MAAGHGRDNPKGNGPIGTPRAGAELVAWVPSGVTAILGLYPEAGARRDRSSTFPALLTAPSRFGRGRLGPRERRRLSRLLEPLGRGRGL